MTARRIGLWALVALALGFTLGMAPAAAQARGNGNGNGHAHGHANAPGQGSPANPDGGAADSPANGGDANNGSGNDADHADDNRGHGNAGAGGGAGAGAGSGSGGGHGGGSGSTGGGSGSTGGSGASGGTSTGGSTPQPIRTTPTTPVRSAAAPAAGSRPASRPASRPVTAQARLVQLRTDVAGAIAAVLATAAPDAERATAVPGPDSYQLAGLRSPATTASTANAGDTAMTPGRMLTMTLFAALALAAGAGLLHAAGMTWLLPGLRNGLLALATALGLAWFRRENELVTEAIDAELEQLDREHRELLRAS